MIATIKFTEAGDGAFYDRRNIAEYLDKRV